MGLTSTRIKSYTPKLGRLQQRILRHFLECERPFENSRHISKQLKISPPAAHKSMDLLVRDKYVKKGRRWKSGEGYAAKPLTLTHKGVAAAILCGNFGYDAWLRYTQKTARTKKELRWGQENIINKFESLYCNANVRDIVTRKVMELLLASEDFIFNKNGQIVRFPSSAEMRISANKALMEFNKEYGRAGAANVRQFLKKYDMSKESLRNILSEEIERNSALLRELDGLDKKGEGTAAGPAAA